MSHPVDLVSTLAALLSTALVLGLVAQRLGLSAIVGYLVAGIVVGPFTPGYVAHGPMAEQLAEVGVVLLMFSVGLKLDLRELLAVRKVALPGAVITMFAVVGLAFLGARWAGLAVREALVAGMAAAVASTVVVVRVLGDHDALHTPVGHVALAWLVVEDLVGVMVLLLLPSLGEGREAGSSAGTLALAGVRITLLFGLTWLVGRLAIPRILARISRTRSRELFTLAVLVLALSIAVGAARLFGASMALGAFLAGLAVGRTEFGVRAAAEAVPFRDAFAVLFFVSVGMLFDPKLVFREARLTLAILTVVLLGKPLVAFLVMRLLGRPRAHALPLATLLAQVGELTFLIAAVGKSAGLLESRAAQALVATSIVSIMLSPILFGAVRRHAGTAASILPDEVASTVERDARAIVVGYGPVGRTLTRLLRAQGIEPTVIELNDETVRTLRRSGTRAIHGDATHAEVLLEAGVGQARTLIFAASGTPAEAVIQAARAIDPDIRVLARTTYVRELPSVRAAGADVVVTSEAEVALAMAESVLREVGASGEQLDRARDRVRGEVELA